MATRRGPTEFPVAFCEIGYIRLIANNRLAEVGAWAGLALGSTLCGAYYSVRVVGHHPSSSGGWFDLRAFDPIGYFLQDAVVVASFIAVGYAVAALGHLVIRLASRSVPSWAMPSLGMVAVLGLTFHLYQSDSERRAEQAVVQAQADVQSEAFNKAWREANRAAFADLGWVRYPNVDLTSKEVPQGFEVRESEAKYVPMDPPETSIDYYLSRADSWEMDGTMLFINVHNGKHFFRILPALMSGAAGRIYRVETLPVRPYKNLGPASWANVHPASPTASEAPAQEAPPTPAAVSPKLAYPGARPDNELGLARLWTTDSLDAVTGFYRGLGLASDGADDAQNQVLTGVIDGANTTVKLNSVHTPDGLQGVLIRILPAGG